MVPWDNTFRVVQRDLSVASFPFLGPGYTLSTLQCPDDFSLSLGLGPGCLLSLPMTLAWLKDHFEE